MHLGNLFAPIKLKSVTESEIYEINKSLKWKTSYGYDEVPPWIVKLSMPFISSPLIYICNKMLSTGTFPTWLKKFSQVLPLFKKGNKTEMSDYRPVSLLTSFCKIFEKVIYNRLLQHTKENNIIDPDQYGFKNNSSTELAIFKLINQTLLHINNKSSVCGIFCDLTKAFDTVNHDILISKLEYYSIIGRTNKLMKSYLSNQYQRITIKTSHVSNCTSAWELVKHGVPQGSILGPLLFLFYINDLPQLVKDIALPILFADDTSFIIANSNSMNMNQDLKLVLEITQKWFKSNIMLLNYDMTSFMQFSSNTNY